MTLIPYLKRTALLLWLAAIPSLAADDPAAAPGDKTLPMPGEALKFGGRDAFIIAPPDAADGSKDVPWVWYAPTLSGLPSAAEKWMFEKFLAEGIAIAGIDVGESYGSPDGCAAYSAFYRYLTGQRGFRAKPCLLARSRGGLMLYNWAAENPGKVGGIAGIYPVGNLKSYPVSRAPAGPTD
ncbi:MAG: hypothetical protein R3F11_15405 [Verrucomicrobiales bacterium]